jgi:hypothetical protein
MADPRSLISSRGQIGKIDRIHHGHAQHAGNGRATFSRPDQPATNELGQGNVSAETGTKKIPLSPFLCHASSAAAERSLALLFPLTRVLHCRLSSRRGLDGTPALRHRSARRCGSDRATESRPSGRRGDRNSGRGETTSKETRPVFVSENLFVQSLAVLRSSLSGGVRSNDFGGSDQIASPINFRRCDDDEQSTSSGISGGTRQALRALRVTTGDDDRLAIPYFRVGFHFPAFDDRQRRELWGQP